MISLEEVQRKSYCYFDLGDVGSFYSSHVEGYIYKDKKSVWVEWQGYFVPPGGLQPIPAVLRRFLILNEVNLEEKSLFKFIVLVEGEVVATNILT